MDKVSTDLTCFVGTGARNDGIKMINQNATPISKIDGSDKSQVQISGNEENDNSRQDNDTGKGGSIELFSDNDVHRLTSQQKLPRSSSISNINRRSRKNQSVSYEKLKKIKATVDKAIQEHKVFIVYGRFKSVRAALKERGWIEKCNSRKYKRARTVAALQVDEDDSPYNFIDTPDSSDEDLTESLLISRLLRHKQPDLIWTMRHEALEWRLLTKDQLISRYPNSYFTTKVGLCTFLQQLHWFCEAKVSETFFPRCFNVGQPDELTAFVENYRLTACISLLKWLVDHGEKVYSEEGKVPWKAVEFAMKRVSEYIRFQKHEDIDMRDTTRVWEHQWSQFLLWYTMAVHEGAGITGSKYLSVKDTLQTIRLTIEKVKQFWPQLNIDGVLNIWIMKPAARSRGRGISLVSSIDNVMCKINSSLQHTSKFVVQKYLERPLLICNTKFDIRQWFLVTDAQPLTIWMYKESYLRFCSQSFSLSNYHESVHLCNNSVQSKYKNGERDDFLPDENMWDSYTFQAYLRTIDQTDMWGERIYPGMKKGIIGAMLASQEHMDIRKNCFELYGADFMISEDFYPWLIEINSCPCMAPTTSITARMCPQCLEDVIKVVIDRRDNDSAEIGMFELIYKQHTVSAPPYMGVSFTIQGTKLSMNAKNGKVKKGPEDSAEVYDLKPLFEAHQKGESGKQNAPDTVTSINLGKETSLCDADLKWAQSSDVKTLHETKRHSSEPSIKLGHKDGSRSTNGNSKPHTERIRFKLHASRKGAPISHETKDTKVNQEETDEAKAPDEKSTACEQAPETAAGDISTNVSGENNPSGEEQLFQRRENCATKYWKNHQAYKSLELLKEWREKLQQTRVNCEIMLTNLQLFKENEKAIANNNNTSTDKCCLWDQKKSHAKTTEETASHENLPVPPKEPHSIRPKNSNHKSRRSNSRLPMTPPVYVPVIDKNPSYSLFKGPLPCIKQKNKLSSYKNSDLCKFRKLKEIDFCYDALKSSVARKNNVMLPVNSTYCLKINSKEYVNTVCENM